MIELFKEFTFESAHQLAANVVPGHPYANIHGHSFRVEVFLRGEVNPDTGWVMDFADVERILDPIQKELDHTYLNTIEGLEQPTLENITRWIWERVIDDLPGIHRVVVRRGTCGQGCVYFEDKEIPF
jgi:6-pyruvoyltetrahydropterin/6-carboxytetrahydropterin synthase